MQKKKANSQNNEKKKVDVCGENGAAEKDRCYTYMVRCSDGSLYTGWRKSCVHTGMGTDPV